MRSSLHRSPLVGIVPLAAALALAGCGSGSTSEGDSAAAPSASASKTPETPSASELYEQARKQALAAKSAHLAGDVTQDGTKVTIDLAGTVDGSNQALGMTMGDEGKLDLLTVGGKYYFAADQKFWTTQGSPEAAAQFKGKFLLMPPSEAKEFGDMTIAGLLKEMFQGEKMNALQGANSRVEKATVDGKAAFSISDRVGGDGAAVIVSADGKANLLKMIGPKSDPGTLTFSEWNAVKPVVAPAASKVIDVPL